MSGVDDNDTVGSGKPFVREDVLHGWLQKMQEQKPSVVEKLHNTFGPGHSNDAWRALFPPVFQDSLEENSTTADMDWTTFFDCAKLALQSVHGHEKEENELNEAMLAKNICRWVHSLREELIRMTVVDYSILKVTDLKEICRERSLPVTGRKAELIERIEASDLQQKEEEEQEATPTDESPQQVPTERKTVFEVEEEARELGRQDNRLTKFQMMMLDLEDTDEIKLINLLKDPPVSSRESQSDRPQLVYGSKRCTEITLSVRRVGETDSSRQKL